MQNEAMRAEAETQRLSGAELHRALRSLKDRVPAIRARDAAKELGVTEAELVACRTGDGVTRLDTDFADILRAMPPSAMSWF